MALAPLGISLFGGGALNSTLVTASMIFGLILLPFAILGSGILTAYTYSTWTLTFRRLTGRKAGAPAAETAVAPIAPAAPVAPEAPGEFPPDA
jgi:hypothetical protein